jgi:hypothetical protein
MRLAYADPPYPGRAHLYRAHPDFRGEVDHRALVASLGDFHGWALSTNSDSLASVLSLCPPDVQVAAWVRTNAPPFNPDGKGSVRSWEPVIYRPARVKRLDPGRVRDVFHSGAPTGNIGGQLTGAKTRDFACWVFGLLVAEHDDTLEDLFPGTGAIGRAWQEWQYAPTLFGGAIGGHRSGEERPRHALSVLEA